MSKAYLGCHTDITIPYDELGAILVETADGREIPLIQDGRFVLAGTEELNKELERTGKIKKVHRGIKKANRKSEKKP